MRVYNQRIELIVDPVPTASSLASEPALAGRFKSSGLPVEEVIKRKAKLPANAGPAVPDALPLPPEKQYVRTQILDAEINPWDAAHMALDALPDQVFIEPDFNIEYSIADLAEVSHKHSRLQRSAGIGDEDFDPDWLPHKNEVWHLGDAFSQLRQARDSLQGTPSSVRIGHLDTGYSVSHEAIPETARLNPLQRNFVDGELFNDAHDPRTSGPFRMPGHGTATMALLAGNRLSIQTTDGVFTDYLGGAWMAEVVTCRISPTVILLKTSAFAEALNYLSSLAALGYPVQVACMSMGGLPSRAWADAVNRAYDAGITVVAAAGNNFNGFPTTHVVYPARFKRVIATCGVTYDYQPYASGKLGEMQGNFGPERHMDNVLSAFTPNIPWATGDASLVKFSGAGTSSAAPQVAAAAALYYLKHAKALDALPPWQRVEAIRHALFSSASKAGTPIGGSSYKKCFGQGILKAYDALQVPLMVADHPTVRARVPWFPIVTTLFGAPPKEPPVRLEMFNTELAQLVYEEAALRLLVADEEKPYEALSKRNLGRFRDAVIAHPAASRALKKHLVETYQAGR